MAKATVKREKRTLSFGHTDVKDSVEYVRMLRRRSRGLSDAAFLKEIRAWQRSRSIFVDTASSGLSTSRYFVG